MTARPPDPISLDAVLAGLTFLADRSPAITRDAAGAFAELAPYRDGGIFVGHWAGSSEWERHTVGDEIVMALEGATTIFFLNDEGEESAPLAASEMVIVPQGTWHRFETPVGVKLLTVTPQPTDHSVERPS